MIAVSEHTKRELVELLGVARGEDPRRPERRRPRSSRPDGPAEPGDYVLAVGTLEPRKNLARLAEATRRLGVELRVVGRAGWGDVELRRRRAPARPRLGRRARAGSTAARAASPIRRSTRASASRSLEAMASGTPVVTSRGGATEEVAGGAAVLVDPLDPAAIAAGIEEAASAARRAACRRGLERARDVRLGARPRAARPRSTGRRRRERSARRRSTPTCSAGSAPATRRTSRTCCARLPGAGRRRAPLRRADAPPRPRPGRRRGRARARAARRRCGCCDAVPRALRRLGAALAHFQHALPLSLPVPGGRDRPRPLVRARPVGDGPARPARLPPRRARARCAARARVLAVSRADEGRPRRALRRSIPSGSPSRRTASTRLSARASAHGDSLPAVRRRGAAPEEPARPRPRRRRSSGCRSSSSARAATRRSSDAARARTAPTSAATSSKDELVELYRGAAALVLPSRYEGFGLPVRRGDGERHAGRRRAGRRRCARSPATPPCSRTRRPGRGRSRERSPTASRLVAAGLERAARSPGTRRRGARSAVYQRGARARMKISAIVVSHGHREELAQSLPALAAAGRRGRRDRQPPGQRARRIRSAHA